MGTVCKFYPFVFFLAEQGICKYWNEMDKKNIATINAVLEIDNLGVSSKG